MIVTAAPVHNSPAFAFAFSRLCIIRVSIFSPRSRCETVEINYLPSHAFVQIPALLYIHRTGSVRRLGDPRSRFRSPLHPPLFDRPRMDVAFPTNVIATTNMPFPSFPLPNVNIESNRIEHVFS